MRFKPGDFIYLGNPSHLYLVKDYRRTPGVSIDMILVDPYNNTAHFTIDATYENTVYCKLADLTEVEKIIYTSEDPN